MRQDKGDVKNDGVGLRLVYLVPGHCWMSAKVCVWRYLKAQREFFVQHLYSASYSTHRKVFHFASVHCK